MKLSLILTFLLIRCSNCQEEGKSSDVVPDEAYFTRHVVALWIGRHGSAGLKNCFGSIVSYKDQFLILTSASCLIHAYEKLDKRPLATLIVKAHGFEIEGRGIGSNSTFIRRYSHFPTVSFSHFQHFHV